MNGRILLLDGTSSAGKSTLCRALLADLDEPFSYLASDLFVEAGSGLHRVATR